MTKPLCIGMPGCGLMGRAHSNAYAQVGHFFDREHPYMNAWWVPGCTIGYEHMFINSFADFLASLEGGDPFMPDMKCALRTQKVCEAVLDSAKQGAWVEI